MDQTEIKHFIEAALFAAGRPLNVDQLKKLFDGRMAPEKAEIRAAVATLNEEYEARGIVVAEVASGFRLQIREQMVDQLQKLWEERPPRYSRALFETLALIAYRQPITRGEIEEVRGVAVSANIIRTLMERDWVRVVGHRDVPGRPEIFGTTRTFLDYFGLKKLDDLPPLADLSDWETLRVQLNLPDVEKPGETADSPEATAMEGKELPAIDPEAVVEVAEDAEAEEVVETAGKPEVAEVAETTPAEDENIEELVVSEWPDPSSAKTITTLETRSTDDEKDASAGSG